MFPKLSGGIAIYAHEAWKRYLSFVGPVAAFGYWIGWSVVLSATGVVVGFLVQAQFYPLGVAASSWNHTGHFLGIPLYFSFPIALTIVIIVVIWVFNVLGMRPAVWVGYVTGALLLIPLAVIMFLPYITGDWHSSNLHTNINWHSLTADNGIKLVIVWLYVMCWSSYGMECCATFAPEYHDTDAGHRQGAARRGGVRRDRLRPAAAGRGRHVRRPEHHARQLPRQLLRRPRSTTSSAPAPGSRSSCSVPGSCSR